jgi:hypothetical protein
LKTLAQAVVFLMEQLTTAEEPGIDWQACGDIANDMWLELAKASSAERRALAEAASARLADLLREPDEHGYTPRALVTPQQHEFLATLADRSAWHDFEHEDHEAV